MNDYEELPEDNRPEAMRAVLEEFVEDFHSEFPQYQLGVQWLNEGPDDYYADLVAPKMTLRIEHTLGSYRAYHDVLYEGDEAQPAFPDRSFRRLEEAKRYAEEPAFKIFYASLT